MGSQGFYTLQGMSDLKVYRQFSPLEFKDRTEERYTSERSTKGILKECGLKEQKKKQLAASLGSNTNYNRPSSD